MLHNESLQPGQEWIRFSYRTSHPVLRFLPTKLAEFIGENYASELGIPLKTDLSKWNPAELNTILKQNLVPCRHGTGHLRTFGCIQWECELFNGRPKARCYPFDLDGHRF